MYLPFEEARALVRQRGLASIVYWDAYRKSGLMPAGVPQRPQTIYKDRWLGYPDWLGNNNVMPFQRKFRPFEEARSFVRSLGLRSRAEWGQWRKKGKARKWCSNGVRPADIPSSPHLVYAECGWAGYTDWLGVVPEPEPEPEPPKVITPRFLDFEQARDLARAAPPRSKRAWMAWWSVEGKGAKLPRWPNRVYAERWSSWHDWLGTPELDDSGDYASFKEAKAFVARLGVKTKRDWEAWSATDSRPAEIPARPQKVYRSQWVSWPDWFGRGPLWAKREVPATPPTPKPIWLSLDEIRTMVRAAGIATKYAYVEYAASIPNIPVYPNLVFRDKGWISWRDLFGLAYPVRGRFLSFEDARAVVRGVGMASLDEWSEWSKTSRPPYIPGCPSVVYADLGWVSFPDWVGKVVRSDPYLPFEQARAYVRALDLRTCGRWKKWSSTARPDFIPPDPGYTYRNSGWAGFPDWLRGEYRTHEEARAYVRSLGFKSREKYLAWARTDARPADIPFNPERFYGGE